MRNIKGRGLIVAAFAIMAGCQLVDMSGSATTQPSGSGATTKPAPVARVRAGKSVAGIYNVRDFGAAGDGKTIDSPAINAAIEAAAANGGGTVRLPAGTYLSYSIRLKSNITLFLDQGTTIRAARKSVHGGSGYDPAEDIGDTARYQDYGHSHWHNSLIWGENIENVTITGPGLIDGAEYPGVGVNQFTGQPNMIAGLSRGSDDQVADAGRGGRGRGGPGTQPSTNPGDGRGFGGRGGGGGGRGRGGGRGFGPPDPFVAALRAATQPATAPATVPVGFSSPAGPNERFSTDLNVKFRDFQTLADGAGNKAIALKLCKNVTLSDFSILRGGHFALLATGVDNFTIDNLKVDTQRDGFDIDGCRNVRVSNCSINSPTDDAICLKSSYGLGYPRACENVTITNCLVSGGWVIGTMLDGTYREQNPGTGRIKFGTESNGGFKNITISNIVFDRCQGLALEAVDGAIIDNISITNITMREIGSAPIFIRLGDRRRGPADSTPVAHVRHINISDIVSQSSAKQYACIISGIPDHRIEDVRISNIRLIYPGGAPAGIADLKIPENEFKYPEPNMFGVMAAYGFFIRHVDGIQLSNIEMSYTDKDLRPPFMLDDVRNAEFSHIKAQKEDGVPTFMLKDVEGFRTHEVRGMADTVKEKVEAGKL